MHHFVVNTATPKKQFYKRDRHLVRTPIKLTLKPDQRAYYSVAGSFTSASWPEAGFIEQLTYNNVVAMGAACITTLRSPPNANYHWRSVTTSHDPETVWYQGGYATSAPNLNAALDSCEAYTQLGAYHFTFPSTLRSLTATNAKVTYINGGGIQCFQSAGARSANNRLLKGYTSEWNNSYMRFVVCQNLTSLMSLLTQPQDSIDMLQAVGTPRNIRDLWAFTGTNRDGAIPVFNEEVKESYSMGANTLGHLNTNKGCWIVPCYLPTYNNATSYRPMYVNSNPGWWACFSCWGLTLEVELD